MKVRYLMGALGVASVVLMGAIGSARAADKWFVLGEQTIKSADPSADDQERRGSMEEEGIKQAKISVEGADVEITKVVLHWDNRRDDTIMNVGVVKSGGETAAKDAPGRKGRLTSVAVQYKILNDAPTATVKVWGFD